MAGAATTAATSPPANNHDEALLGCGGVSRSLDIDGGLSVGYEVHGNVDVAARSAEGRLTIICLPGLGDVRGEFRRIVPMLAALPGEPTVVSMDLRGLGGSSADAARWRSFRVEDTGADIVALLDKYSVGRAVVVGDSFAGGAAVCAADTAPERVAGIAIVAGFVFDDALNCCMAGVLRCLFCDCWGAGNWARYVKSLYKDAPPPDLDAYMRALAVHLKEPGRMAATSAMMFAPKSASEAALPRVRKNGTPVLCVYGTKDPDWDDPEAYARRVMDALGGPADNVFMVAGAGHYPHAEQPAAVAERIGAFIAALPAAAAGDGAAAAASAAAGAAGAGAE